MSRFRTCWLLVFMVSCPACRQDVAGPSAIQQGDEQSPPPLEINFRQACCVAEGRQQAYDSKTGVFHIHFKPPETSRYGRVDLEPSAFEVMKVAERFTRPIVFRMTGVPIGYGCVGSPLALTAGEKRYPMIDVGHDSLYAYDRFDRTLFRVENKGGVVTVEFTEKGQALLKPGTQISFTVDSGW
jgi:hypothetical protein